MSRKKYRPTGKLFLSALIMAVPCAALFFPAKATAPAVRIHADRVINADFLGFGVETLPWLWSRENQQAGVDDRDVRLNLERIRDMRLPFTRVFVPWETWNPRADYARFTWDSPTMQSLYKTLDLCQETGTQVIVVTVDWLKESPWRDTQASAGAVVGLLEHLIRDKGYSCVRFWTLTNEPERTYEWLKKLPFENYVRVHQAVKAGLEERGLPVKIIVSDEVESREWFDRSVRSLNGVADAVASHLYCSPGDYPRSAGFLGERVASVRNSFPPGRRVPFFLTEFGFRGAEFGPCVNTFMEDYEYGLYTALLCADVLNSGVSAASLWCLHQIRVIDEVMPKECTTMRIGLWAYKDRGWRPFPVFYLYRLFTRYVRPGSRVLETQVVGTGDLRAACVERRGQYSLFIVNPSGETVSCRIEGLPAGLQLRKYAYTASAFPKEGEAGRPTGYRKITVPARSALLLTDVK